MLLLNCCCVIHGMGQIINHASVSTSRANGTSKSEFWHFIDFQFSIAWEPFNLSAYQDLWVQCGDHLFIFQNINCSTKARVMNCLLKLRICFSSQTWVQQDLLIQRLKTSLAAAEIYWIISLNRPEHLGEYSWIPILREYPASIKVN